MGGMVGVLAKIAGAHHCPLGGKRVTFAIQKILRHQMKFYPAVTE